jgi:protein-tyrosine-phosphatase
MSEDRIYNVLFLCTYNSGRSIMAEAILNREGNGRFRAFSGGSHPTDQLNPHVVALLKKMNYPTDNMRSKHWSEFARDDAPTMDFVITVCDQLAKETCPAWPGSPIKAHWGFPDPADFRGKDAEIAALVGELFGMMYRRITIFAALPVRSLNRLALQERMDAIGSMSDLRAGTA